MAGRRGATLLELLFALAIFSLVAVAAIEHVGLSWSYTRMNRDRIFAYRKALSLLAELKAYVEQGEAASAADLDRFDDGTVLNNVLTITTVDGKPVPPDHPASQNSTTEGGRWRWARQISVRPFPGQRSRDVRFVTVRIFRRSRDGRVSRLAETSSVIRSVGQAYPTAQVYDVYLLALENVPGWWVYMEAIRPFVEATLTDLEARNPGLKFRTHWITRLGYGRDPFYSPYFNETLASTDEIPWVYFYPGRLPPTEKAAHYYVPQQVEGMSNVDGTYSHHWHDEPFPYTLADQFNHCLRLPDAMRLFQQRAAVGWEDPQAPTWRLLLEDMVSHPEKYHNAILVNLHGELLPMPPLRNYADAAKAPETYPGARVVTHPEQLRYDNRSGPDVRLRVYTYRAAGVSTTLREVPFTVRIRGLRLPPAAAVAAQLVHPDPSRRPLLIEKIEALTTVVGGRPAYVRRIVTPGVVPPQKNPGRERMYVARAYRDGEDLVVEFRRSPLTCPPAPGGGGLERAWRLYGEEYIPCPLGTPSSFARDLTARGSGPKNTARWILTLRRRPAGGVAGYLPPPTAGDRLLTVETYLGDTPGQRYPRLRDWERRSPPLLGNPRWDQVPRLDPTDPKTWAEGSVWRPEKNPAARWPQKMPPYVRQPTNLSRTYVYWTDAAEDVPFTERFQFQGDPRHCPYLDLRDDGAHFPHGYNWFFDDFRNPQGDYRRVWGFTAGRLRDGWLGRLHVDVPRFMQLLRRAVTGAEVLYTTLTGFSYYYLGLGGEIGYDRYNGFPDSIPVHGRPYGTNGVLRVDSISVYGDAAYRGVKLVRSGDNDRPWWGRPWLGELYPDRFYAFWQRSGNLPAGKQDSRFYRARRQDLTDWLPRGTTFRPVNRLLGPEGSTAFFNIGTRAATFHHKYADGTTGTLTAVGREVGRNYNFTLPTVAKISRPFHLAARGDGGVGPEFDYPTEYPRYRAAVVRAYFDHALKPYVGSALVELQRPAGDRTAYVVVNGIDRTTQSGSAFIAKYSMLTLVHSLLEAGDGTLTRPVARLPRVVIRSPTATTELVNPKEITVKWETQFARWDGKPYSLTSRPNPAEREDRLVYALLYSADNGKTWRYLQDDSPAVPGTPPPPALLRPDRGPGPESYPWPVPASRFPEGSYLIRVEAYRTQETLHYAHHMEKIYIERS